MYAAIEAEATRLFPDDFHTRKHAIDQQVVAFRKMQGFT